MQQLGLTFAILGAALSALISGMGSSVGVGMGAEAAAGVLTEDPSKFGKVLLLQLLPGTQGIYGFIIAFLTLTQIGVLGGSADITLAKGLMFFAANLPMAVVGYYSALRQGRASVASIALIAKKPNEMGKAMTLPATVETYAILALLVSILAVMNIAKIAI